VQPVCLNHRLNSNNNGRMLIQAGDITHGGLSLKETPAWTEAKKAIESESGYHIVQWHRDELSGEVSDYRERFEA
jgi:hypothetical protein